jgi:hypothetical protein
VRDLLKAAIGPGKAQMVKTISMNFDRTNRLATRYNPKSQVVRSRQTNDSTSDRVDGQNKTVSVQNNSCLPINLLSFSSLYGIGVRGAKMWVRGWSIDASVGRHPPKTVIFCAL